MDSDSSFSLFGETRLANSPTNSGIEAVLVAIRGISQLIASITGYPKPSYNELTIAIELDAYSFAISSLVRSVLKVTLS